jgi:putative ABC transport system permease protein
MYKHYLTTALRHFRQHKLTTAINVVCLTIGLVCFLASYAMVAYFSSGDRHYPNADRTYIIRWKLNAAPSAPMSPWLTAKYLKTDFPEIQTIARATIDSGIASLSEASVAAGDRKGFVQVAYADPEFLEIFALPFLAGDSKNALRLPRSAVISKDTAIRLFGSVPKSLGSSLRLQDGSEITVRGVVDALKQPSHISTSSDSSVGLMHFDVLVSMDVFETIPAFQPMLNNWKAALFLTYVLLPQDGSFTALDLRNRLQGFGAKYAESNNDKYQFGAAAVSDYWISNVGAFSNISGNGNNTGVLGRLVFYFLGTIVLLISCLNYANLATAQGITRAKEIGMRRVVGASRGQIIVQFMIEAVLLTIAALIAALFLITVAVVSMCSPGVAAVVGSTLASFSFWLTLATVLLAVTIAAGAYPAFVLSSVRPLQAVRAGKTRSGGRFVPRLLVGMQFGSASFLLIAMIVMYAQSRQLKQAAFTNSSTALISISNNVGAAGVDFELLRSELQRLPQVQAVTASEVLPWVIFGKQESVTRSRDSSAQKVPILSNRVHHDFFSTLGIRLLAGRVFDREHASDDASLNTSIRTAQSVATATNVVIDRAFAEQQGWLQPTEALGKTFYAFDPDSPNSPPLPRTVIGVVETRALTIISPLGATATMYMLKPATANSPIIRISTTNVAATLKEIETVWNRLAPSVALKMRFADELLNDNSRMMSLAGAAIGGIATLALLISILGLIGMSMHVIGRRQHEIGVRKTLGASVRSIVQLLLTDFSKPVIVANIIAWPLAFITMQLYVSLFTQRTSLSIVPFISSLVMTVLIAWLAVAAQATRAARMNPATVLRTE